EVSVDCDAKNGTLHSRQRRIWEDFESCIHVDERSTSLQKDHWRRLRRRLHPQCPVRQCLLQLREYCTHTENLTAGPE
ncbi:hypothetical protein PMAYCL1PPCAC_02570, partial [Pristionchus mayeri]